MHCVDLGESFQTRIYLQNLASIQPRTSPIKFARYRVLWTRAAACEVHGEPRRLRRPPGARRGARRHDGALLGHGPGRAEPGVLRGLSLQSVFALVAS